MDKTVNETESLINRIEIEIPKSTLYWFFISLAAAMIWTIYLAYYNSRVMGLLASFIINKFFKNYGHVNIGKYYFHVFFYTDWDVIS